MAFRSIRPGRTRTAALVLLSVVVLAGGCTLRRGHGLAGGSSVPSTYVATPNGHPHHVWIFTKGALESVDQDPTAAARLRTDRIYEILDGNQQPTAGFPVIPMLAFTDYADLEQAVRTGSIPSYIRAVLYDNESWTATPATEQLSPAHYYSLAASLLHNLGLQLVSTPAIDLTKVLAPEANTQEQPTAFLHLGLLSGVGQVSDVVDIQAQRLVDDLPGFTSFVQNAVSQIRAANPHAVILAGLSTCNGGSPSASELLAAAEASAPYVAGWWMNVPGGGVLSPGCGAPRPQVADQFIDLLPGY